jgi:hypothetical protein
MNIQGRKVITILKQIFWPPMSPISATVKETNDYRNWWKTLCVLTTIPFTAILHHVVFFRSQCMLNPFFAPDYTLASVSIWLSKDPSLPWAAVLVMIIYYFGKKYSLLRIFVAPVFVSFLPLSVWIWDIPFTGRFICHHFHDKKVLLMGTIPLKSWLFYLLGGILYIAFVTNLLHRRKNKIKKTA